MALNLAQLVSDFENLLTLDAEDVSVYTAEYMAEVWATAYDNYASNGTDGLGNAVSGMNKSGFQSKLEESFNYFIENPEAQYYDCIPDITEAVNIYWTGVILGVSSLPPGGIAPISNAVVSTPGSISFSTGPISSIPEGALRIANSLHNKTTAVSTSFNYIHSGSPPYADTYTSTIQ